MCIRDSPKMAEYIYTERNGIYIIDLQKSVGKVDEAYKAVADIAAEGGKILFVGTKKDVYKRQLLPHRVAYRGRTVIASGRPDDRCSI